MTGFRQDDMGDWVAQLSCLHSQHLRHDPPFRETAWVLDETSRRERVGQALDCPRCDRAELPDGLEAVRTTPTWDRVSAPAALLASHRVAASTWGILRVEEGQLRFHADTSPPLDVIVDADHPQAIPPEVEHHLALDGDVRFAITFLRRSRVSNQTSPL